MLWKGPPNLQEKMFWAVYATLLRTDNSRETERIGSFNYFLLKLMSVIKQGRLSCAGHLVGMRDVDVPKKIWT